MFYCIKCHKIATIRHKCNPLSFVSITRNMRFVVDTMNDLGFKMLTAVSYVENVNRSFLHKLELEIEFRTEYNELILQSMPTGWTWYKFSVKDGEVQLSGLRYIEEYLWTGADGTVTDRLNHIITEFEAHLATFDPEAFKSVLTLMYS